MSYRAEPHPRLLPLDYHEEKEEEEKDREEGEREGEEGGSREVENEAEEKARKELLRRKSIIYSVEAVTSSQPPQQQQGGPKLFTFSPFPKYSVNIVTGPTFVGKTYFITQLVNHYKTYFESKVGRVFVVLCNSRVNAINFSETLDVPVEQVLLSDFNPDQLEFNDLVIIDDLQHLTREVKLTISVCAHHTSLASLFVVTHSLLGSSNFELLSLCHRIFLFLGSSANNRLTSFILDRFFTDPEIKTYLKTVLNYCSGQNEVLALELSPVGLSPPQVILAFSHLSQLHPSSRRERTRNDDDDNNVEEVNNTINNNNDDADDNNTTTVEKRGFCLLYPSPHFGEKFASRFSHHPSPGSSTTNRSSGKPTAAPVLVDTEQKEDGIMSINFIHSDSTRNLPPNTLIALPAQFVIDQVASASAPIVDESECVDRESWKTTMDDIEDNIESFFPLKRWKICKNLAREILSNPKFCVTRDGKHVHLMEKPHTTKVNLLSFLGLATRKAGPSEKSKKPEWAVYMPHIRQLLASGTPKELFANTLLLKQQHNTDKKMGGKKRRR